jgi:hypothetical protein
MSEERDVDETLAITLAAVSLSVLGNVLFFAWRFGLFQQRDLLLKAVWLVFRVSVAVVLGGWCLSKGFAHLVTWFGLYTSATASALGVGGCVVGYVVWQAHTLPTSYNNLAD